MTCEQCGSDYHRPLTVIQDGKEHTFDCFQCAIAGMAPDCAHCGCKIIGHGMTETDELYCCANCAMQARAVSGADAEAPM